MFGPDLHVFTLKVLALQKLFFNSFRVKKILKNFLIKSKLCNFSVRMLKCFQRIFFKKWPQKRQKKGLKSCSQWATFEALSFHSPAQNWFFILWNLGIRHLFSNLCLQQFDKFYIWSAFYDRKQKPYEPAIKIGEITSFELNFSRF